MANKRIGELTDGTGTPIVATTKIETEKVSGPTSEFQTARTLGDYVRGPYAPFYNSIGADPVMGIPGATFYGQLVTNTFTGQRIFYSPFILRQKTKFIGITAITGGTVSNSPTFFWGIYTWDRASGMPTTLQASVSQAVLASTGYDKDFASPVTLDPGTYAAAFLCDKTGTQSIFYGEFHMGEGDGFVHRSTNTFLRPRVYASAAGKTTLPSPETVAPTGFADAALSVESYSLGFYFFNYFRYQAP